MQLVKLHIITSLIIEAVKAETYIRGAVVKAADDKTNAMVYQSQAGDEKVHERKLMRNLYHATEELKTYLTDYLDIIGYANADNNIESTIDEAAQTLDIEIIVSERFNKSYTESLARLCSRYIEDSMIISWFLPVDPNQAQVYRMSLETTKQAIQRCFNKLPPIVPAIPYPYSITPSVLEHTMNPNHRLKVTYAIGDDAIDDVQAKSSDTSIASVRRTGSKIFSIYSHLTGEATITLFSKHKEEIKATIAISVVLPDEGGDDDDDGGGTIDGITYIDDN
jgi:hypothetical protein